ncbi:MAG: hypothetical protein QOK44_2146 [Betaproteobacteria bacterium]|jgi:hypothetical protein|nr:hypothetical protein [Betaproteobacteria bacterium]
MRPSRQTLRFISSALIALLLFAQGAFAMQPCVDGGMSAAAAMEAMAESSSDDCCGGTPSVSETHLCAVACTDQSKLVGSSESIPIPLRIEVALLLLPALDDSPRFHEIVPSTALAAAPPKSILFCSFLI